MREEKPDTREINDMKLDAVSGGVDAPEKGSKVDQTACMCTVCGRIFPVMEFCPYCGGEAVGVTGR